MIKKNGDNVKLVQEVNRRKMELIIYAAFFTGFIAHSKDQRSIDNPDNFTEIHNLINLISNDIQPKKENTANI